MLSRACKVDGNSSHGRISDDLCTAPKMKAGLSVGDTRISLYSLSPGDFDCQLHAMIGCTRPMYHHTFATCMKIGVGLVETKAA